MDLKPKNTHDLVLAGIMKRKQRQWEKKQAELKLRQDESDLRDLDVIHKDYYIDVETEAWLKSATEFLFSEFPNLDIELKREVVKKLNDDVTISGPPEKPMKVVVRDAVNLVLG